MATFENGMGWAFTGQGQRALLLGWVAEHVLAESTVIAWILEVSGKLPRVTRDTPSVSIG